MDKVDEARRLAMACHDLGLKRDQLKAALVISRGQWIHSVNARQCMEALGESEEAIKRQEEANMRLWCKGNNHG